MVTILKAEPTSALMVVNVGELENEVLLRFCSVRDLTRSHQQYSRSTRTPLTVMGSSRAKPSGV